MLAETLLRLRMDKMTEEEQALGEEAREVANLRGRDDLGRPSQKLVVAALAAASEEGGGTPMALASTHCTQYSVPVLQTPRTFRLVGADAFTEEERTRVHIDRTQPGRDRLTTAVDLAPPRDGDRARATIACCVDTVSMLHNTASPRCQRGLVGTVIAVIISCTAGRSVAGIDVACKV